MANKITVTSVGTTANVNATPDAARYYSDKSKEWAISDKIVDNTDYSSKYYANESKKQADISTAKTTEVVESGNNAVSNIENARDNAITDITNQENVSVDNVNTAGATQVALATEQANIATQQATIATNKASEVVASGNEALSNIDTAKSGALTDITDLKNDSISSVETVKSEALTEIETLHSSSVTDITGLKNTSITDITTAKDNAITSITNQETISKTNLIEEGAIQANIAKEQAILATEQATIATTQASIATSKTAEVVESGNTALSNIETAKSNALNDINTTGAEYVNNTKQYAQNALNSANNAKISEKNALSYKNSAMESSQTATEQANISTINANNAKTSETNAKSSETRCEEILSRLGTAIKIKGRVNSLDNLPLSGNLDGDAYLIGEEGLDSYPEYYWYQDHWEFLGTSGTTLSWGLITGNITAQTDLQAALDSKQDKGDYALKSEIPTNNKQLINGAGYITSSYHDSTKQDVISDLETIRNGAAKGATAVQPTSLAKVATTGSYNDLSNKPTIPTVNNGMLTIQKNGVKVKTFTANQSASVTANIVVPTKISELTNDSNYITSSASITGNAATATKATQDGNGNNIVNTYATKTSLNAKANTSLSNLTDAGKQVIKDNSGSGLELCDIGMALYVDETKGLRRRLNGSIMDITSNYQAFLTRLLEIKTTNPDYFTDEATWQSEATLNVDGCVYKFVLNYDSTGTNVVSVRLPKYPDYVEINAGGTLPVVGNGSSLGVNVKDASLREILQGANYNTYVTTTPYITTTGNPIKVSTDPTKSGIQTTLKQTKLKLRYFIQIATGSETENNIINEIELNNPYSLFDSKYSDHELNNLSWLKSEGQWNAKATYPTAYDKLLKVYNGTETVAGLSVKLSTETYTDYDFVLNTSDETFRLPLKTLYSDDTVDSLSLYFYVGETVQNANLIDAGRIGEVLPTKTDMLQASGAGMPSNKYIDLTLGESGSIYTAPANGWYFLSLHNGSANTYSYINNITTGNIVGGSILANITEQRLLPIKKGDSVMINYGAIDAQDKVLRFVYAEGAKNA